MFQISKTLISNPKELLFQNPNENLFQTQKNTISNLKNHVSNHVVCVNGLGLTIFVSVNLFNVV
jgi:hypothetical protein